MTKREENRTLEWLIRLIIVMPVIGFGVFRHLFGVDEISGNLLESGLASSSIGALIETHVMTALELVFVVITLTCKFDKKYLAFSGTLTVIYFLSAILSIGNVSYTNSDFASLNRMTGLPLVALMVSLIVLAVKKWGGFEKRGPAWLTVVISILLIGGYGVFYSIHSTHEYVDLGEEYEVKYANWEPLYELQDEMEPSFPVEEDYTLCIFSTTCSHCNLAAKRLGVYLRKFPEQQVLLVFFGKVKDTAFWETDDVVNEFMERNHIDLPYLKMKDYEAISIGGNQFPSVMEMSENKPQRHYVGTALNAWAFDQMFK